MNRRINKSTEFYMEMIMQLINYTKMTKQQIALYMNKCNYLCQNGKELGLDEELIDFFDIEAIQAENYLIDS